MRRAAVVARRRAPRRLRRPRRRALPLRPAVARRRQPGRGRGAGGVPPRLAGLGVLRPGPRLAAHLAVRHPPQRGDRPGAGSRRPPAAGRRRATSTEGAADDELDRALTAWQVESALAELDDDHRRVLVEVHWRGPALPRGRRRPRHPGGHGEEPRVLRAARHAHERSRPRGGEMAERPLACEAWQPTLAGWLVAQLPPDEEAALARAPRRLRDLPGGGRQPPARRRPHPRRRRRRPSRPPSHRPPTSATGSWRGSRASDGRAVPAGSRWR